MAATVSRLTGSIMPCSQIIARISRAGVTSNAQLYTRMPSGAVWRPNPCVTSSAGRQHGDAIRSDFVGGIAIRGNADGGRPADAPARNGLEQGVGIPAVDKHDFARQPRLVEHSQATIDLAEPTQR